MHTPPPPAIWGTIRRGQRPAARAYASGMVASSAGGDASLGAVEMELAIALFERGFPEARVQEALRHCGGLDEAIQWLSGAAGNGKAKATETSKALPAPIANAPTASRRRAVRKVFTGVAGTEASATAETTCVAEPAVPAPKAPTTIVATSTAAPPSPAAASAARHAELEVSPGGGTTRLVLPIVERDASAWWREAAVRFHENCAESLGSGASPARTPKRKREASEELPGAAGSGGSEAAAAKTEDGDAKKARPSGARPPATPCSSGPASDPGSAEAGGQAEAADDASAAASSARKDPVGSPAPSSKVCERPTPQSSPRSMRLNNRMEMCEICCNDVPPWRAVRLGCSHGWYCAQCMLRHSEARLSTGAASISCPECCTPLAERDLRKLLPQETIDRLLQRSLEQAVSSVPDLWACPTPNCPMRVALEDGEVPRLKCTFCKKSCCLKCGVQPFHKGLTCEEHKERMSGRPAKSKNAKDEEMFNKWLKETGTKQCPTCRIAVSKQNIKNQNTQYSECHKMCCRNCNTRFCFKCLSVLSDAFTCGCTINAHGFIDPRTGKRLQHLDGRKKAAKKGGR